MARAPVLLADLLTALRKLKVTDAACAATLARMLGIEALPSPEALADRPAPAPVDAAEQPPFARGPALASADARAGTASAADTHAVTTPGAATLALLQAELAISAPVSAPLWVTGITSMARAPAAAAGTAPAVAPDPLFEPSRQRALLGALLAAPVSDGEVDLDALIEQIARRQLPRHLPRRTGWSLRRGVQLLADRSPAMLPFDADVDALLLQLRQLMPADRIQLINFVGSPLSGCRVPGGPARLPWVPPPRGTPVLLVSDLGIGGPEHQLGRATPSNWRAFAAAAIEAGVGLRTLVPFAPASWPAGLGQRLHALHWDRRARAAEVRRLASGDTGARR